MAMTYRGGLMFLLAVQSAFDGLWVPTALFAVFGAAFSYLDVTWTKSFFGVVGWGPRPVRSRAALGGMFLARLVTLKSLSWLWAH